MSDFVFDSRPYHERYALEDQEIELNTNYGRIRSLPMNKGGARTLSQLDIYPGAILWMPHGTPGIEDEKCNHPVIVIRHVDDGYQDCSHGGKVVIVIVTSFNDTSISTSLPSTSPLAQHRASYIPLDCTPPQPHPDTGLLLKTTVLEGRPSMLYKQSYAGLEPFTIPKLSLLKLKDGKIRVEERSFKVLLREISTGGHDRARASGPRTGLWAAQEQSDGEDENCSWRSIYLKSRREAASRDLIARQRLQELRIINQQQQQRQQHRQQQDDMYSYGEEYGAQYYRDVARANKVSGLNIKVDDDAHAEGETSFFGKLFRISCVLALLVYFGAILGGSWAFWGLAVLLWKFGPWPWRIQDRKAPHAPNSRIF
ncbi:hypothetical protein DFH27DRAFT_611429 [Peziza echinospora]|nr:hypothetical protein DFH27DRAFT_611429 [Peziza echinospora]